MYIVVLIAAVLVVLATQIVKRVEWGAKAKNVLAVVVSTVAAGVIAYLQGPELLGLAEGEELEASQFLILVSSVFGTATLVYNFIKGGGSTPPPGDDGNKFDRLGENVNVLPAPKHTETADYEPKHAADDEPLG